MFLDFNDFNELNDFDEVEKIDLDSNEPVSAIVNNEKVRKFLLAGNCHCHIENMRSGNSYEYKIQRNKKKSNMYFVNVMSGVGEIYCGYFYINSTLIDYRKGDKGSCEESDPRIQTLLWTLRNSKKLPSYVIVQHFGRCACCGSPLDVESLHRGLCSICEY